MTEAPAGDWEALAASAAQPPPCPVKIPDDMYERYALFQRTWPVAGPFLEDFLWLHAVYHTHPDDLDRWQLEYYYLWLLEAALAQGIEIPEVERSEAPEGEA